MFLFFLYSSVEGRGLLVAMAVFFSLFSGSFADSERKKTARHGRRPRHPSKEGRPEAVAPTRLDRQLVEDETSPLFFVTYTETDAV